MFQSLIKIHSGLALEAQQQKRHTGKATSALCVRESERETETEREAELQVLFCCFSPPPLLPV